MYKLLLKIMTNGCAEDSKNVKDSDYFISSDESDSEEDDPICPDSDANENKNQSDIKYQLNKFFENHVEKTEKYLPLNVTYNIDKDVQFEEKMYRVIPIKIDPKISKLKNSITSNKKKQPFVKVFTIQSGKQRRRHSRMYIIVVLESFMVILISLDILTIVASKIRLIAQGHALNIKSR
ncbi:uncharacterized protein LOC143146808 [Ptiloglossa arizonensis]|uniref:uncharacterized protein LOC143146808 n=1 Tax=Ptiloglossa arizonensis TaxID=3350558 RepID=UPI003FA061FC